MSKTITKIQIRQGDVYLESVADIPSGAVEVPIDEVRGVVLAEGEVTGHAHRIPRRYAAGKAAAFRTEENVRFMRVTAPISVPFRHEEHKTRCSMCQAFEIATHRVTSDFTKRGYLCDAHAASVTDIVALAEPGATDIPTGNYRVTIHAEYQPGELPRNVAD